MSKESIEPRFCLVCGGSGLTREEGHAEAYCPSCGMRIRIGDTEISVSGHRADEVQQVSETLISQETRRLAAARDADRRAGERLSTPWIAGSFYLFAAVTLIGVILAVATVLQLWVLPVVIAAAVVLLVVVGALQLRQDAKLSEESFLALMRLALAQMKRFDGHARPPE